MGIIIGKFRKKKSTYDTLEKLENQITAIEEFGRSTEQFRKKIIGRFLLLAVFLYLILAIFLYYYYHKISSDQRFLYIIPIVALPVVILIIKKIMTWYYSRKMRKNEKTLIKLRDEKKKILDNVMETETYKVAKKILDKFGNEPPKIPQLTLSGTTPLTARETSVVRPNQTGLRQRTLAPTISKTRLSYGSSVGSVTPFPDRSHIQVIPSSVRSTAQLQNTPLRMPAAAAIPLPRSILPKERSVMDKMIHYLIGDGPSNRYALICKKCFTHNGMAFKEDFEYLSFRCCYCSHLNPAKKQKPTGPELETTSSTTKTALNDTSESDKETVDSDDEDSPETGAEPARGDSPDTEKNSDFDKLSDLDTREMESTLERGAVHPQEGSGDVEGDIADTELVEEVGHSDTSTDTCNSEIPMEIDPRDSPAKTSTEEA
ncbi:hypothetical protein JTB14_005803 [Gonioctena quinquepunctata]|nr:hypothetical protein JTB14_005803 [Gonioctena quinquepunctata]